MLLPETTADQLGVFNQFVECIDHHHRHVGIPQQIDPFLPCFGGDNVSGLTVGLVDVGESQRHGLKARVLGQLGLAGNRAKGAPVVIPVGQYGKVEPVRGFVGSAMGGHQSHVTRLVQWRLEALAPQMLGHDKGHHALEHGHLNGLTFAGPLAMKERRQHALHHHESGGLVGNNRR